MQGVHIQGKDSTTSSLRCQGEDVGDAKEVDYSPGRAVPIVLLRVEAPWPGIIAALPVLSSQCIVQLLASEPLINAIIELIEKLSDVYIVQNLREAKQQPD